MGRGHEPHVRAATARRPESAVLPLLQEVEQLVEQLQLRNSARAGGTPVDTRGFASPIPLPRSDTTPTALRSPVQRKLLQVAATAEKGRTTLEPRVGDEVTGARRLSDPNPSNATALNQRQEVEGDVIANDSLPPAILGRSTLLQGNKKKQKKRVSFEDEQINSCKRTLQSDRQENPSEAKKRRIAGDKPTLTHRRGTLGIGETALNRIANNSGDTSEDDDDDFGGPPGGPTF